MNEIFYQLVLNIIKSKNDQAKTEIFVYLFKQAARNKADFRIFAKQFIESYYGNLAIDLLDVTKEKDPYYFDIIMREPKELFSDIPLKFFKRYYNCDDFCNFSSAMYNMGSNYTNYVELIAQLIIKEYKASYNAD